MCCISDGCNNGSRNEGLRVGQDVVKRRYLLISLNSIARGVDGSNKDSKHYEAVKDERMINVMKICLHSILYIITHATAGLSSPSRFSKHSLIIAPQ
jgi:hypothetical protein